MGHKKIAVIGGEREYSDTGRLRYAGVLRALTERGITFDANRYYKTAHYSFDEGYTAMAELLRETSEITAVFAMADVMAIGAARAVRDAGKRIPEDISLIGFDGTTSRGSPPLRSRSRSWRKRATPCCST